MKRYIFIGIFCFCLLVGGCGKKGEKDIIRDISKKVNNTASYYLEGNMELINNEESYKYDVEVSYKKKDMFKVSLINKENKHEQIILKNSDGVYIVTPALNKSFKFESNWPYNNSQVYLLQSIITDINNDSKKSFKENGDLYIITSKVVYPNNRNLKVQNVYLDKKLNFKKVEIDDKNGTALIKMNFNKIDFKAKFDKDDFALEDIKETVNNSNTIKSVSSIDSSIYPMYMPEGTSLVNEDSVEKENGERVILTFDGDKPFMIVEETVSVPESFETIPVSGDPVILTDTVAAITDTSVNFISNGIEYYIVSDVMATDELLEIAQSMSVSVVEK